MKFEQQDYKTFADHGIKAEVVAAQFESFEHGFPYLKVVAPALPGNGIFRPSERQLHQAESAWSQFLKSGKRVVKMVPASGAASRMFKALYAFAVGDSDAPNDDFVKEFFGGLTDFAFFAELSATCIRLYGKDASTLKYEGRLRDIAKALLYPEGMNYGNLPKALLIFHKDADGSVRKAFEEHLAEGAQYAADSEGNVHIHFTVSPGHLELMKSELEKVRPRLEEEYGVRYDITFSTQKPSTDTPAANSDNTPYRENGEMVFRPGGHGALIHNLQDIDADVIFIKNIDNVVPDNRRDSTIEYKRVLGGILVDVKQKIDYYAGILRTGFPSRSVLNEMLDFLHGVLCISGEKSEYMDDRQLAEYILEKLNRPVRVCGMVKNDGEPGGGPFLVRGVDGTVSPQILESTQFDSANSESVEMLRRATHFNPVDIACCTTDLEGHRFDLSKFVDPLTGFISHKSHNGVEIKALELPGLWNGAMSDWNTIFVEVPADTFNPVKTVNDLLRPAHQSR